MHRGSDAIHAAQVERIDGLQHMHIPAGQTYKSPGEAYVEGDASSASYFLAGDSPAGQLSCCFSSPQGIADFAKAGKGLLVAIIF